MLLTELRTSSHPLLACTEKNYTYRVTQQKQTTQEQNDQ